MGNCVFRGLPEARQVVKVVTANGGIMELHPPVTADLITNEFPGYGIFHSHESFFSSKPLHHTEELIIGKLYYLLPLAGRAGGGEASSLAAPYRMSLDHQGAWRRVAEAGAETSSGARGVWKVKLVISPERLKEILSQEARTEALIDSVRTVAKCGSGFSPEPSSDQLSLASGWKT